MRRYTGRIALAMGFIGAVAIAGAAFGQVGGDAPVADAPAVDAPFGGADRSTDRPRRLGHRVVTGTVTIQTEDGFATRQIDGGTVSAVDGSTLTIERADGVSVSATVTDRTRVMRDGERAEVADLQVGDRAHIMQLDAGDGFEVRAIIAVSPEHQAEREAERDAMRAERHERRDHMRERFRQWLAEQDQSDA